MTTKLKLLIIFLLPVMCLFSANNPNAESFNKQGDKAYDSSEYIKAVKLYTKACDGGIAIGCSNLGSMYRDGDGVEVDGAKAIKLFTKACDGGSESGCSNLGGMSTLLTNSCDNQDSSSCEVLGSMFISGKAVTSKDLTLGIDFYKKACKLKVKTECTYVDTLDQFLSTNANIPSYTTSENGLISLSGTASDTKVFIVRNNDQVYMGSIDDVLSQVTAQSSFIDNPFKEIQRQTQVMIDNYLSPRKLNDITWRIPEEIEKPTLPPTIQLVKDEFESKAVFAKRVDDTMKKREEEIAHIQAQYREQVEKRNKIIEALKFEQEAALRVIEAEQKAKHDVLPQKIKEFSFIAFKSVMKSLTMNDPKYDPEDEIMYITLKATGANYVKKAMFKMPPNEARVFKQELSSYQPKMLFEYNNGAFLLKKIEVSKHFVLANDQQKGQGFMDSMNTLLKVNTLKSVKALNDLGGLLTKNETKDTSPTIEEHKDYIYTAVLTENDYKPEVVKVAIEDKKVDFASVKQNKYELQNPNLTDRYQVQALGYGESSSAKGIKYEDDLTPAIKSMSSATTDPTKWLFVVGIENYKETDKIPFSKNSAEDFKLLMQKKFGISERNTYALIDDGATGSQIEGKLSKMLANVKQGDTVYFYYNGHGVPDQHSDATYILPSDEIVDFITKKEQFKFTNIYKQLADSPATKVIAVVDSCFSGKGNNGSSLFKGTAGAIVRAKKFDAPKDGKVSILTAGSETQFSNSYNEKGHRLLSYFVMKSLLEGKTTMKDIYLGSASRVKDVSSAKGDTYIQEPQILGNSDIGL